jgi:hypothetical protein
MSHEEIDQILASEIKRADIASPYSEEIFYALMNGENSNEMNVPKGVSLEVTAKEEEDADLLLKQDGIFETWRNEGDPKPISQVYDSSSISVVSDITADNDASMRLRKARRKLRVLESNRRHSKEAATKVLDSTFDETRSVASQDQIASVSFSTVDIRYYERVIDINPSVTCGVAVGIGWRYKNGGQLSLDDYEIHRGGVKYKSGELVLPRGIRENIVRDFGFTQKQITDATRICIRLKNQRKQTIDNLAMGGLEEKLESATRKMMKVMTFGKYRKVK